VSQDRDPQLGYNYFITLQIKTNPLISRILFSVPSVVRWLIFAAYLSAIVFASLTPPSGLPRFVAIPNIDKVIHFTMYFGFCLIGVWVLDKRVYTKHKDEELHQRWIYPLILSLAISWGVVMEIFQRVMAVGRHYSVYDLVANILGAITATALYYYFMGRKARR